MVLQHLMDGFISLTIRHEDLNCSLFRYIVREMLACAIIRPIINLANPRFISERIENVVQNSARKPEKVSPCSKSCARIPSSNANPPFWIPIHIVIPERPTESTVFNVTAATSFVKDASCWQREHEWRHDIAVITKWLSGVSNV
ncbi:hypothetical protein Lser_V15G22578 [Lactuca serriola]